MISQKKRLIVSMRLMLELELFILQIVEALNPPTEMWSGPRPAGYLEVKGQNMISKS